MWGAKHGRKTQSVLPEGDVAYEKTAKPPRSPLQRQVASLRQIRWRSPRTWIWLLLILNLVVVLGFIFMSARYFPKAITPEHQSPLLSDSHDAKDTLGPHRPLIDVFKSRANPPNGHQAEEKQSVDTIPQLGKELQGIELTATAVESSEPVSIADPARDKDKRDLEHPIVDADEPLKKREKSLGEFSSPATDIVQADRQQTEEPIPLDQDVQTNQQLPSHIAGMLERVKASRQMKVDGEAHGGTDTEDDRFLVVDNNDMHSSQATSSGSDATTTAFNKDLFVWLKADEGVKVVNEQACLESQNPDACELTSWTNHIRSSNALVPTAFQPVSTSLRPVWMPKAIVNGTGVPSVAFSCPLKAKYATFPESMTLFFVILPTHIELGDSYAGQKFFGSSPYGQFALHGGKPAFFGSTGLIEFDELLQSSQPSILIYRLRRHSVEIKVHGRRWSSPPDESRQIRLSQNADISLGNVKAVCDTNAFRGQISEVMLYSAALDDDRVALVEAYLEARYLESVPTGTAGIVVSEKFQDVETETPKGDTEDAVTSPLAVSVETESIESSGPATHKDAHDEESVHQSPSQPEATTTSRIDDFNPELVFEWAPSQELLSARSISPTVAEQWKSSVQEKIETIQNFQLGGEVLRDFIHQQKEELLALHDELFG